MWSYSQQCRLAFDKKCMERHFPQFHFYNPTGDTYILGCYMTTCGNNSYDLKITIPPCFPDEAPELFVSRPLILPKRGFSAGSVNDGGTSHEFHTKSNGPGGCVQICYSRWDPSMTCAGVALQGMLWTEFYCIYMATGISIAELADRWREQQQREGNADLARFIASFV